ncbi:transglycosylase SLT domain-containing protein [Streptomyces sp. NPDC049577]|uniref:transglycosylase SLT domain-containing protein n=1 Tax=Streptomyces sp. NPDC049577 TaxID=3155153 RepID=UPI003435A637
MRSTHSGYTRLTKAHKISATGIAAASIAAAAFAAVSAGTASAAETRPVKTVAWNAESFGATQQDELTRAVADAAAQGKTEAAAVKKAAADADAKKKADADAAAKAKADKERVVKAAASRSEARKPVKAAPAKPAAPAPKAYGDNLEGWIAQALDIMHAKGIPGSYDGVKRNIMRESTGNPKAINDWDVNAVNGVPSKGLLQIIDPTFKAYHVEGTSWDIWDPVANIVASCNYAADKYGSMDNVNSAY